MLRSRSFVALLALVVSVFAAQARADVTLGVASPSVRFSPGNWVGNSGRGGDLSRTSWYKGAWCEWHWKTSSQTPTATLNITNQTSDSAVSYFVDGSLVDNVAVPSQGGVAITGLAGAGEHSLIVYTRNGQSQNTQRWNEANAFTVSGLTVDGGGALAAPALERPWVMIVGDSITEGIYAGAGGKDSSLSDYAFLVGQGLRARGYDTCVSACGYSGWICRGDSEGDVPGYYAVHGGVYLEQSSRWNKIDSRTSLLDSAGHISGHGGLGQEPSAIVINDGVNETLQGQSPGDTQASVAGCLAALRQAAPKAYLFVLIPPGLEAARLYTHGAPCLAALRAGVAEYESKHPADKRAVLIDLGPNVANALASPAYGGGVHPNGAGQAYISTFVLQSLLNYLK